MTYADILTFLRLILVPVFVAMFVLNNPWAFWIFVIAGATDLIDGTIARLTKQVSQFGAFLDPIADKLLVNSCFACLVFANQIAWWFWGLVLVRDVMILSGIYYLERTKKTFEYRAVWTSKFATFFQLTVAVLSLWNWKQGLSGIQAAPLVLMPALIAITSVLLVLSGIQYVQLGKRIVQN